MNKWIQTGRRISGWILCLVMLVTSVPIDAFAQPEAVPAFGEQDADGQQALTAGAETQIVSEPETILVNKAAKSSGSSQAVSRKKLSANAAKSKEKKAPYAYRVKQKPDGTMESGTLPDSLAGSEALAVTKAAVGSGKEEIISYELSANYYVRVGAVPKLPAFVKVTDRSGAKKEKSVEWDTKYLTDGSLEKEGSFVVGGRIADTEVTVSVRVNMVSEVVALLNYSTGIRVGQKPLLPEGRPAVLADGTILDLSVPVAWENISAKEFQPGITAVTGTADVFGKKLSVTAFVRVGEQLIAKGTNAAQYAFSLTQNIPTENQSDHLEAIRDQSVTVEGNLEGGANQTVWTNRGNRKLSKTAEITFGYAAAQKLEKIRLYHYTDAQTIKLPKEVKLYASDREDKEQDYRLLGCTKTEPVDMGNDIYRVDYTFHQPETAAYFKIELTASEEKASDGGNSAVGLAEAELYTAEESFEVYSTEKISGWKVHGVSATNTQLEEKIFKTPAYDADVEIFSDKNAAYTILPAFENVISILTESEDHKKRAKYQVRLQAPEDIPADDAQSDYPVEKLTAEAGNAQPEEPPQRVLDRDPDTLWHTGRSQDTPLQDRWITLTLQEETRIKALRYLPDQKEKAGRVTKYKVEFSSDRNNWKEISAGSWENTADWKAAMFDQSTAAKYVRLTGVECATGSAVSAMSAAELRVVADYRQPKGLSGAVITLPQEEYLYTGAEIRPRPASVTLEGKNLVYGLDYIVSYQNNTEKGTASVIVTGVNDYTGAIAKIFRIVLPSYQVAFETNGGTYAAPVTVEQGGRLAEPSGVTRANYTLEGWYRDGAFTRKWNFAADTVTEDMVLYAKWVSKTAERCIVTFDSNGGTRVSSVQVYKNSTVREPSGVRRTGYTLEGWYSDEDLKDKWNFTRDKVTSDMTLYAKWKVAYTVTFVVNGGTSVQSQQIAKNGLVKEPSVSKAGYILEGWYSDSALTKKWDFSKDKVTGSLTLYAKWTAAVYKISFETNGGSTVAAIEVAGNSLIREPSGVTKAGYSLEGWYTDSSFRAKWDFARSKVSRNMTLYAKWVDKTAEKYTVSFETNGGSTAASVQIYENGTLTEPSGVIRNGYALEGWYRDPAFKSRWNFATDKVTADMTLYARWAEGTSVTYIVSFETNGGSQAASVEVYPDGTVPEPFDIVREGYILEGWYQDPGFTMRWDFASGRVNGNLTLYANWLEEEKQKFVVSFETNGGSPAAPTEVELGKALAAPAEVMKEGCILEGWYRDAAFTAKWDFASPVTEAMTLYAKWIIEFQEEIRVEAPNPVRFNGMPYEPELKVYDGETLLTSGEDYNVLYKNNIYVWDGVKESKRPQAVIQGKGNYSAKTAVPVNLQIMPKSIEDADIVVSSADALNYNSGKKLNVPFTVKHGKKILSKTKDLTISYEKDGSRVSQVDSLGSYTIVAEGKGNYTGTIRKNLVVVDASKKKLLEELSFQMKKRNFDYTGEPVTIDSGHIQLLVQEEDLVLYDSVSSSEEEKAEFLRGFEILYQDNQEIGTAAVIIRAREENESYKGSKTIPFKIQGTSITKAKFREGSFPARVPFTGENQEPKPELYIPDGDGEISLTEGVDYNVAYQDNRNAGKAAIKITGIGAYFGVLKKSFTIQPVKFKMENGVSNVSEVPGKTGTLEVSMAVTSYEQNRAGVEPQIDLIYRAETGETCSLIEGEDYTLSYRNNKNVSTETRIPSVDVKLMGNFKGSLKAVKTFEILPKSLDGDGIKIEAADVRYRMYAKEYKTKVTVYDNGVKLDSRDFKVESYQDNNNEGFEAGSQKQAVVTITTGISGNYKKTASAMFLISERLIDKAAIKITPKAYTGEEVKLTGEDIIQAALGEGETKTELTEGKDFRIVEDSYVNNIKCGTAKVTVEGIGNYAGSREITFRIMPKELLELRN